MVIHISSICCAVRRNRNGTQVPLSRAVGLAMDRRPYNTMTCSTEVSTATSSPRASFKDHCCRRRSYPNVKHENEADGRAGPRLPKGHLPVRTGSMDLYASFMPSDMAIRKFATSRRRKSAPLIEATLAQDVAQVAKLVHEGVDLNEIDAEFGTALHCCMLYGMRPGRWPIAELLLATGADPNLFSNDETPLMLWSRSLRTANQLEQLGEIIELFKRHGARLNARAPDGSTALHKVASALRDAKLWPGRSGQAWFLVPNVWLALVEAGADPTLRDNAGRAPKDLLSKEERERLLKHIIRIFLTSRESGEATISETVEVVNRCLAAENPIRITDSFLKKHEANILVEGEILSWVQTKKSRGDSWQD